MLGGIFSFHSSWKNNKDNYDKKPLQLQCTSLNLRDFQFAQSMLFAIEEINNSTDLLPGITLGYKMYDTCGSIARSVSVALALLNGNENEASHLKACTRPAQVQVIMGETSSSPTAAIATAIGPLRIPIISHFATCACLSNRQKYPTFFRTVPSDNYQSKALAKLVSHFGWTWVGAVAVDNEYGLNGITAFIKAAEEYGVCIEYSEAFSSSDPPHVLKRIIETIRQSTSKVIVAFVSHREIQILASELYKQNITGLQWIGSDAWITDSSLTDSEGHTILLGSLGFAVANANILGLGEHLRQLHPSQFPNSQPPH
ncbi:extracellular calcium-sensing receptor-like [Fundulus diaphanus]